MGAIMMHQVDGDPQGQLEADWQMFRTVEAGRAPFLWRCWESREPIVVIGRHGSPSDEAISDNCRADGIPIIRRVSGGGAVVLGPGCLNYTVAVSLIEWGDLIDVARSFRVILRGIVEQLDVPGLAVAGGTDLALHGRKVSGNAQRRGRTALLHHGTVLYDFDVTLANRYLREPMRQPAYRAGRSHRDFIANLPLPGHVVRARLDACIMSAWLAQS